MRRPLAIAALAFACVALLGCSDDAADAPAGQTPEVTTPPKPVAGALTVLAEPELVPTMEAVVPAFEASNPDATVVVEPLPAADIVARVQAGGGDAVALADTASMDELEGTGLVAAVVGLPDTDGARAGAVVSSTNPSAATRFVELAAGG